MITSTMAGALVKALYDESRAATSDLHVKFDGIFTGWTLGVQPSIANDFWHLINNRVASCL